MTSVRALDRHRSADALDAWQGLGLLSLGRRRVLREGEVLLARGLGETRAALVLRGLVKITAVNEQGREMFLAVRGEGDLIGEEAAIPGRQPQAGSRPGLVTATALTRTTAARVFPVAHLREFLDGHPAAMLRVANGLCERLADAEARIAGTAWDTADTRLARLLWELEHHGNSDWLQGGEGIAIPVQLTHAELASWIGASRETVDRALRRWRAQGILSTSKRRIVIHDFAELARIAQGSAGRSRAAPGQNRWTA